MKSALWNWLLWGLAAACWLTLVVRARSLGSATASIQSPMPNLGPAPVIRDRILVGDSVLSAAEYIAAHDPFRIAHEPSLVAYGAPAAVAPPIVTRPALSLVGIVGGGTRWAAIVGGVPGHEGHLVLQAGDSVSGLRVSRVTAGNAVVHGRDTTWVLRLGNPWP